jgi:hypothetical protein
MLFLKLGKNLLEIFAFKGSKFAEPGTLWGCGAVYTGIFF